VTRVYVAASQHEYKRARAAMFELRFAGCTITHDWTLEVEAHRYIEPSEVELQRYALADYRGVVDCDVLLVLTPERPDWGKGMHTELGIALDRHRRIVVTGPGRCSNVFMYLCERYATDQDGIDAIVGGA
jgi:hypothetical protein